MSIAYLSTSEAPISAQQANATTGTRKPPRRRQIVAKADIMPEPEAR